MINGTANVQKVIAVYAVCTSLSDLVGREDFPAVKPKDSVPRKGASGERTKSRALNKRRSDFNAIDKRIVKLG